MRVLSLLACTLVALILTGCAPLPPGSKPFYGPRDFLADGLEAERAATSANYTLDIRTNELHAEAPMIRGIRTACARGVQVNVVLYVGGRNSAPVLAGTCAQIFVSDYPELQYGAVGVLVDGNVLMVNGRLVAVRNNVSQAEYAFMHRQKRVSMRVQ